MSCSCQKNPTSHACCKVSALSYVCTGVFVFALWGAVYWQLEGFSRWLVFGLMGLQAESQLGNVLQFFCYDAPKILLLLVLMVYCIGWLRAGLQVERVRDYLAGKGRGFGYLLGAGFGAITPFCSCSSIPLFLGFTMARIPLGITMAFLITSPLVNEIAVVLLWGLLGWKFTVVYVGVGMFSGIVGGMLMDAVRAERWLAPFLLESLENGAVMQLAAGETRKTGLMARHGFALAEVKAILRRVWHWIVIGVGVGALLHGYVPEAWFAEHLGAGQWWSVPMGVCLGIPLYTNVTGIVPVMESLLLKGLPLGTTLAFCMSTVAASLPEVLMLRQVMRWPLLALFLGMLLVIFTLIGWFFNAVTL